MSGVACVLLGAGLSRRMGGAKLLHEIGGRTVFEISLENHLASSLPAVCAVVAGWLPGFRRIMADQPSGRVTFLPMDEPGEMSASLKAGWRWLEDSRGPDAIMISLADQPLITPRTIDLLIDAYSASGRPVCVPTFEGRPGHPVIISTDLSEEVMKLEGDHGAREVLISGGDNVHEVAVDSDEVVLDFDRPEDMKILISRLNAHE